jgi:hypothetical protein
VAARDRAEQEGVTAQDLAAQLSPELLAEAIRLAQARDAAPKAPREYHTPGVVVIEADWPINTPAAFARYEAAQRDVGEAGR